MSKRDFLGDPARDQYEKIESSDRFVSYVNADPEHLRKARETERAVMEAYGRANPDGTCLDAFVAFVRLAGVMAKMGHLDDERRKRNPLADQTKVGLSLDEFLQNCRMAYENCRPRAEGEA